MTPKAIKPNKPNTDRNLFELNEKLKQTREDVSYLIEICKSLIIKVDDLEQRIGSNDEHKSDN